MKHSIIAWDSSYRSFFHLVQGAREQDYDPLKYELIYVEQRSREHANAYARQEGVRSLDDLQKEVGDDFCFHVEYLGDPLSNPYHLGKCVNRGIEIAEGEIVSVMDGDQLLPRNFLRALDEFHRSGPAVANVIRRMAPEPLGVSRENWKEAIIDYEQCLAICDASPIPEETPNFGPLISAPAEVWEAIRGYSTHTLWSTGLSRIGEDVNRRLERCLGVKGRPLPEIVVAHPWHPTGFDRDVLRSKKMFRLQGQVLDYSEQENIVDWTDRQLFSDEIYQKNRTFVDRTLADKALAVPGSGASNPPSFIDKVVRNASLLISKLRYEGFEEMSHYVKVRLSKIIN